MYRKAISKCLSLANSSIRTIKSGNVFYQPRQPPKSTTASPAIASKYQIFTEENASIIQHTEDEIHLQDDKDKHIIYSDEFDGINLERGKTGIFDIEDLVDILKRENSRNIFVASVPPNINYVSYICIVSGRSKKHISALAEFVRKVYKKKCNEKELLPRIEGKGSDEWLALDLGNIALHIFSDSVRHIYDLETLWSVGPEFDEQTKKKNEVVDIFENYNAYLKDLKPLS